MREEIEQPKEQLDSLIIWILAYHLEILENIVIILFVVNGKQKYEKLLIDHTNQEIRRMTDRVLVYN